jgi:hypothetical protein
VAAPDQVLGHPQHAVSHAVDVGGKRLGDDCDLHDLTVNEVRPENGLYAMTT